MAVSISAVVLLGIVVLVRGSTVRLGSALVCAAFGFFLASTGAAPLITDAVGTVTGWIASI
ncbi:hypothetical protein V5N34_25325 [Streptomyces baarnensis]|uniref:hypothetical protein n=1 Tax=Streptomyces baarnensis TaxID=66872 RepID=UPI00308179F0